MGKRLIIVATPSRGLRVEQVIDVEICDSTDFSELRNFELWLNCNTKSNFRVMVGEDQ